MIGIMIGRTVRNRVLLALALGPLPVACLIVIDSNFPQFRWLYALPSLFAAMGALWGLTAGVVRKSFLRALIGLNVGALAGYSYGLCFVNNESKAIIWLLLHGGFLGAAINLEFALPYVVMSIFKGFAAGALAFWSMGTACLIVSHFRGDKPSVLDFATIIFVPFGLGAYLFLWLIAGKPDEFKPESTPKVES